MYFVLFLHLYQPPTQDPLRLGGFFPPEMVYDAFHVVDKLWAARGKIPQLKN